MPLMILRVPKYEVNVVSDIRRDDIETVAAEIILTLPDGRRFLFGQVFHSENEIIFELNAPPNGSSWQVPLSDVQQWIAHAVRRLVGE
jgi:hypothetical protein